MATGYIYALVDPRIPNLPADYYEFAHLLPDDMPPELFEHEAYIGKTVQELHKRHIRHCNIEKGDNSHRARWVAKLLRDGVKPEIRVIFEVNLDIIPEDLRTPLMNALEIGAIAQFRKHGRANTNFLNGGDGFDSETVKMLMARMTPEELSARARKGVEGMTKEALMERGQKVREARANWSEERREELAAKIAASLTPEKITAKSQKAREAHARRTPEQKAASTAKRRESMTPEKIAASAAKRKATMTPEMHKASAEKGAETLKNTPGAIEAANAKRLATMTPERRIEATKKARATLGTEGRRNAAKKAALTRRENEGKTLPVGIYFQKDRNSYRASVWTALGRGKTHYVGAFKTLDEAIEAVEAFRNAHPEYRN